MEKNIINAIVVMFHHDNGTSWLRGIYTKYSLFKEEFLSEPLAAADMDEIMSQLSTTGKCTINHPSGQWQIFDSFLDEPCNLFING